MICRAWEIATEDVCARKDRLSTRYSGSHPGADERIAGRRTAEIGYFPLASCRHAGIRFHSFRFPCLLDSVVVLLLDEVSHFSVWPALLAGEAAGNGMVAG